MDRALAGVDLASALCIRGRIKTMATGRVETVDIAGRLLATCRIQVGGRTGEDTSLLPKVVLEGRQATRARGPILVRVVEIGPAVGPLVNPISAGSDRIQEVVLGAGGVLDGWD